MIGFDNFFTEGFLLNIRILVYSISLTFPINSCTYEKQKSDLSHNAIWVESMYLRGRKPRTGYRVQEADVISFAQQMKKSDIRYLYLFAGPFQSNGTLPHYPFSTLAKNNVNLISREHPEAIILPWVGGIQHRTVFLEDSNWIDNAINSVQELIEFLEVPGVHIDFEYLLSGDPYLDQLLNTSITVDREAYAGRVNYFHGKLRDSLPEAFISSVVVSTSPLANHWKQQTTLAELHTLSDKINQLSFLFYDTQIHDTLTFYNAASDLVSDISSLDQAHPKVQYLISVGTFVNEVQLQKYRNLAIESIEHTLEVIKDVEYSITSDNELIDGISLYCDWETSETEYQTFYKHWVRNRAVP